MKLKTAILPALALVLALPVLTSPARAQAVAGAPAFVDYQGMVFDGTNTDTPLGSTGTAPNYTAAPTNYTMQFKIYDSQSGGTLIWAETQTVTVSLGAFAVRLGSGASISGLPLAPTQTSIGTAFNGKDRFLELTVIVPPAFSGTPITPRLAFQSSPFSFVAQRAVLADTATLASSVNGVVTATTGSSFTGTVNATGASSFSEATISGGTFGSLADPATFVGNGSGLTSLNGANLINSSVSAAKLGADVGAWSVNGTNRYYNGGNVGIGTNSPSAKLVISGSAGAEGLDLSTTDQYANLRVLRNSRNSGDKDMYIGLGSGTTSSLHLYSNNTETITVKGTNVGIGTSNPTKAKLEVLGNINTSIGNHFYLAGTGYSGQFSVTTATSIYASNDILAPVFRAFSDARIKRIEGLSDGGQDLTTLLGIEVTDYTYIDKLAKGSGTLKKVIAQQVEKVFPQAVSKSTDGVPDIYRKAEVKEGWVKLATDLKKGERVRLIGEKEEGIHEVLEVAEGRFRTDFKPEGAQVFVYGREVNDFRSVDYEAISMLNVSATQQIKREKDAEVKALQEENLALRASLAAQEKRLVSLEAKDQARDAKMASIEKLLESPNQPATRTISLKQGE